MNSKRAVIHLEVDCEEYWLKSIEEGWRTQSVDQWVEWLTSPDPEYEVPNVDWIIALFPGSKKYDEKPNPSIKSWGKPVGAPKDLVKNRCNLKEALVFCPYLWPNGIK